MLTNLINASLKKHKTERKKFHPLDGWRPMAGDLELPSLSNDFTRMYASYGIGIPLQAIGKAAEQMDSYRACIEFEQGDMLGGLIFALPSASLMVVFHGGLKEQRRVSGYVMGDQTLKDCSKVACELTQVFEDAFLPATPRAAEPLRD